MAQYNKVYQQALYYDIALNRDVSREVDFIRQACRHYRGAEPVSVLELACGPGYHARTLARQGIRAIGLDLRPEMIAFAREQEAGQSPNVSWLVGDIRSFALDQPVDMAICMFDGIDPLLTNHDLLTHFKAVANSLTPGGIYLIHYSHPRDCSLLDYGTFRYTGQRDNICVDIHWATNRPRFDLVTAVADVEIEMHVHDNGHSVVITDRAKERLITPQDLRLIAQMSGQLQIVGWHGDFDLNQPFDNSPAAVYMLCVLQKI